MDATAETDAKAPRAPVSPAPESAHDTAESSSSAFKPVLPAEFAGIYEAHSRQVYYLALRLLGVPSQAEDATHDVFLKAWRNLHRFRGDADVRTWLYRITCNHCSNIRSSWQARNIHSEADDVLNQVAPSSEDNPFRQVEMSELGARIHETLNQLTEEYRLLILLVADQELSYDEVAELTGQSVDAVRGKLHRARKAFAAAFSKSA